MMDIIQAEAACAHGIPAVMFRLYILPVISRQVATCTRGSLVPNFAIGSNIQCDAPRGPEQIKTTERHNQDKCNTCHNWSSSNNSSSRQQLHTRGDK